MTVLPVVTVGDPVLRPGPVGLWSWVSLERLGGRCAGRAEVGIGYLDSRVDFVLRLVLETYGALAPGERVVVDDRRVACTGETGPAGAGDHRAYSGTSMAALHVAGIAALRRSLHLGESAVHAKGVTCSAVPVARLAALSVTGAHVDAPAALAQASRRGHRARQDGLSTVAGSGDSADIPVGDGAPTTSGTVGPGR